MYLFISIVLVTVTAREIPQRDYNYYGTPVHAKLDRKLVNVPLETTQRHEISDYHGQNQYNYNHGQIVGEINRRTIDNDRHSWNAGNADRGSSHDNTGSINFNLAHDRQDNRHGHKHSNFNMQHFNVNHGNASREQFNSNRSQKYDEKILQARRQQDETIVEGSNSNSSKRKTLNKTNNANNSFVNEYNTGISTFLNNSNNEHNHNHNINNHEGNQITSKSTTTKGTYGSKSTIENDVTPNPSQNYKTNKGNRTVDNDVWVWDVVETTTIAQNVSLNDRSAFVADGCASGSVKVRGKCIEEH